MDRGLKESSRISTLLYCRSGHIHIASSAEILRQIFPSKFLSLVPFWSRTKSVGKSSQELCMPVTTLSQSFRSTRRSPWLLLAEVKRRAPATVALVRIFYHSDLFNSTHTN